MVTVNEGSTAYLTITFKDKDGVVQVPSSASYQIQDITNNQQVRGTTSITPAETVVVTLNINDTDIITNTNPYEIRRVFVHAVYGALDEVNDEYFFLVKNLASV